VADEVRNLALRAAEAAKNTSGLIEDIVRKVNNGERLLGVTNGAFREITDSSLKVVNLISEIAGASQEQSQGIEQINKAVAEMNTMTQRNAAGAEELASVMAMFRTNGYGSISLKEKARTPFNFYAPHSATTGKSAPMVKEVRPEQVIPLEEGDFKEFQLQKQTVRRP
jgi:methyl-accepting chemotaxis protein